LRHGARGLQVQRTRTKGDRHKDRGGGACENARRAAPLLRDLTQELRAEKGAFALDGRATIGDDQTGPGKRGDRGADRKQRRKRENSVDWRRDHVDRRWLRLFRRTPPSLARRATKLCLFPSWSLGRRLRYFAKRLTGQRGARKAPSTPLVHDPFVRGKVVGQNIACARTSAGYPIANKPVMPKDAARLENLKIARRMTRPAFKAGNDYTIFTQHLVA